MHESLKIRTCEILLAHLSQRLIGELIVYPCSDVVRRRHRPQISSHFANTFISMWPILLIKIKG